MLGHSPISTEPISSTPTVVVATPYEARVYWLEIAYQGTVVTSNVEFTFAYIIF